MKRYEAICVSVHINQFLTVVVSGIKNTLKASSSNIKRDRSLRTDYISKPASDYSAGAVAFSRRSLVDGAKRFLVFEGRPGTEGQFVECKRILVSCFFNIETQRSMYAVM